MDDYIRRSMWMNDAVRGVMEDMELRKSLMPRYLLDDSYLGYIRQLQDGLALEVQQIREQQEQFKNIYGSLLRDALPADMLRSAAFGLSPAYHLKRDNLVLAEMISPEILDLKDLVPNITALNREIFERFQEGKAFSRDLIDPVLQAKSAWLRQAQLPSMVSGWRDLAPDINNLVRYLNNLSANLPKKVEEVEEEELERTFMVKREQLSTILLEKRPKETLSALWKFFERDVFGKLPPLVQQLLIGIVGSLLATLIGVGISTAVSHHKEHRPPRVAKEIRSSAKRVRAEVVQGLPRYVRVVIAPRLIVRECPRQRSRPVGSLYAGDVVMLERQRTRSWSLVEYSSDDGEIVIRGWVFSRYIVTPRGSHAARAGR